MLRNLKDLFGYDAVSAKNRDESIGKIDDAYFDDLEWRARYVIVDTGGWFTPHRVLVAPEAFVDPDWIDRKVPVSMTREQIERAPRIDTEKPVSRQQEVDLRNYYGWTPYWGIGMTPFGAMYPTTGRTTISREVAEEQQRTHDVAGQSSSEEERGDPHLRSAREVSGYRIHASDGEIGHVEDFIVETDGWDFRYLVVDTRNWLPGKKVLVAPDWVESIDFGMNVVNVEVSREAIKDAPEFDPTAPVNRAYEVRLYDYYGRPAYWEEKSARVI